MKRRTFALFLILGAPHLCCGPTAAAQRGAPVAEKRAPEEWLAHNLQRFHRRYDVYSDAFAAGNHFAARGRMYGSARSTARTPPGQAAQAVPAMDEDYHCAGRPAGTCIRASFRPTGNDWGGWFFMNGVFPDPTSPRTDLVVTPSGQGAAPVPNWGTIDDAGVDLSGATELSFWAAGERGGEVIDFFAFGVGHDQPRAPHPDGSARAPALGDGLVRLTREWREYRISLRNLPLQYVLGGFAWVAAADRNRGKPITFFLDDISYDLPRPYEPRFPLSYDTRLDEKATGFDVVSRNTAFTYDAAVSLIALLAAGDVSHARLIADALVYAQRNDRWFTDGRLRNAYQAGDLFLPPGWKPNGRSRTVRMPGWYVSNATGGEPDGWREDSFHVSTHTGNVGWAMLALLAYWEATPSRLSPADRQPYLDAVLRMAEWLDAHCRFKNTESDQRGGYTGGFNGWEPAPEPIQYRSTEHNLDLVSAFERLHRATGDSRWLANADHARTFVKAMWQKGRYLTGTLGDGSGSNADVIPVDVQAWAVLALGDGAQRTALDYAESELQSTIGYGFPFSQVDRAGVWYEGSAQMALALQTVGRTDTARRLLDVLRDARQPSGALPAASKDGLDTGFIVTPARPGQREVKWFYFSRPHVGATAWAVLAERGVNPFAPMEPK